MNERDKETIKLIAMILGNVSAIAIGIALFEGPAFGSGSGDHLRPYGLYDNKEPEMLTYVLIFLFLVGLFGLGQYIARKQR